MNLNEPEDQAAMQSSRGAGRSPGYNNSAGLLKAT